jgi:hypothetical protein
MNMNLKRHPVTFTFSFCVVFFVVAPSFGQSKQAESRPARVRARPVRGVMSRTPPVLAQGQPKVIEHPRMDPPVDPSVRTEEIRPTTPETAVKVFSEAPEEVAAKAPNSFTFFRNTPLASAPVVGGVTLNSLIPIEPSGAANGRVVFYTTNSYAAVSGDGGQTFSYINPFTYFPAANGGFGGDQVVYYERTRGLMFWLLQYNPDNNTNTQRLAVARSQADAVNGNWIAYDFTPATFGFTTPPAGASGFWLDFPDLTVSDNFLYLTTNVFQRILPSPANGCRACPNIGTCPAACVTSGGMPTCTQGCTAVGAVIARIPLNQLAAGQNLSFLFYSDTNSGYRCTHGARTTMYWGAHLSTSRIRIYRWDESSTSVASDDVDHTAYNTGTMTATSPDGSNFAARSDSRILGAYVANGVIGFMWNAAQGGSFPFPHVQWLRFNENNRKLLTQWQIWNSNHAFLYPSVHPNDRGHVGGTMAWGGGTFFPSALAWVKDDFDPAETFSFENLTFAQGTAGPCDPAFALTGGGCYNRWGDYFSTRVSVPYGNTWVGTGFVLNGTNGVTRDPRYVWFGRERDTPPPRNTIFVGLGNTSGWEDGSFGHPYNTVTEGHFAAMPGDTILIGPGNYPETPTLSTPVKVDILRLGGTVIIGRR